MEFQPEFLQAPFKEMVRFESNYLIEPYYSGEFGIASMAIDQKNPGNGLESPGEPRWPPDRAGSPLRSGLIPKEIWAFAQ